MMRVVFPLYFLGLSLILITGFFGCAVDDSSSDASSDDTGPADGGDDSISDDAADDTTDEDAADDADDDADSTRLFLIGEACEPSPDSCRTTSWVQTSDGWREYPIPVPAPSPHPHISDVIGPAFFYEGETGYSVWNREWYPDVYPNLSFVSDSHTWLKFDPAEGWNFDVDREPAGAMTKVLAIFAPSSSSFRAVSGLIIQIITGGWPGYTFSFYDDRIYRYQGGAPVLEQRLILGLVRALSMPDENSGLASITSESGQYDDAMLLEYDGLSWQSKPMPAGLEGGVFIGLNLEDMQNGYAVWLSLTNTDRKALRLTESAWQEIAIPSGCDETFPKEIYGTSEYAVAVVGNNFQYQDESKFWELRNGVWSCRTTLNPPARVQYSAGAIWKNGRTFLVGEKQETGLPPVLIEVEENGVVEISLPEEAAQIYGLHALGHDAPKSSLSPSELL